jgi:hypothetical protein
MSGTKIQGGHGMTNKQQCDEYERKKILWIIKDLRIKKDLRSKKGVHNSADKVEETYKRYITL